MDNPGEILRLCRLCLVKDQVNIPIFEEQGDIRQTFLKIRSCLPVKVSRDDKLPKKICGGCSNKLDLFYEFWSSTANSEKTLQSWLGQEEEDDKMQEITKPVEALVKEESEALEDGHAHDQSFDEATKDEAEAPPAKRARRTAAVKAQINISHDSDEDEDVDGAEPITKIEDESDDSDGEEKDPSYTEVPGTSADDQAGPSGLGKDGVEAPFNDDFPWGKTYECPLCNSLFRSNVDLLKHKIICDPAALYESCNACAKFIRKEKMENHIKRHGIKRKKQQHSCDKCGKSFNSRQYLKIHIEVVHDAKNVQYPCDVCGKIFSTKYRATYHKKTIHLKDFNMYCEQCGRGFLHLTELTTHVRKVHDKEVTTFACHFEHCNKRFRANASLQYHLQIEHSDVQNQHICLTCNKTFNHISLYRRHLTRHSDAKRFKCDLCGNRYTAKHAMEIHRRSHTGERPFMCEICGSSFTAMKFLTVHKVVHSEERPFICKVCGKSFTQKGTLNLHEKKEHLGKGEFSQKNVIKEEEVPFY
ncbi:zinc finger protein 253-like isoform X36 [Euwallacea similis]|uniref:zinc finger protein 253-like isoform X36 n=1 Tax=Euwallacea similis TaxID=1736056 RepID=UPI00344BC5AA